MTYVFIVNPVAGQQKYHSLLQEIETAFLNANSLNQFVRIETTSIGDAYYKTLLSLEKYGSDCVIVSCGGDGTLHEVANAMVYKQNPLIVLPFGTGNDFAKKIYGKQFNVRQVVESFGFLSGTPTYQKQKIDMVSIGDKYYINVMSFGLDTKVAIVAKNLVSKYKFLGQLTYKIALIGCLFSNKKFKFHVDLHALDENGKSYKIKDYFNFTLMAICNGSYYGGGFCPAPTASLNDGILDLCLAEPVSIFEIVTLAPKYLAGTAQTHPKVHTHRILSGKISSCDNNPLPGNHDGEIINEKYIEFKVIPDAIYIAKQE